MRGANRQPRCAAIDQIEIDEFAQRLLERLGGIVSGPVGTKRIVVAGMGQRIGPEKPRMPFVTVDQYDSFSLKPGNTSRKLQIGFCSIRFQNSFSRDKRFCGALPAIRLALMAPIDVPMIQSGSIPASCSA